jgi:hypothetical protein
MDLAGAFQLGFLTITLTLLLVTLLDTAGTLIGVARQAHLLDEDGRLPRLRQALLADSGAAMLGAALGTSTTTAYIESAAGVEEGGRTGLTALVVAVLFVASLFLAPLAETVPTYATAQALLFVACLMATSVGAIHWDEPTEYIPGAYHRLDDSPELLDCHRHRPRLHRLCGAQAVVGPRPRHQCGVRRDRRGLFLEAHLRLRAQDLETVTVSP